MNEKIRVMLTEEEAKQIDRLSQFVEWIYIVAFSAFFLFVFLTISSYF